MGEPPPLTSPSLPLSESLSSFSLSAQATRPCPSPLGATTLLPSPVPLSPSLPPSHPHHEQPSPRSYSKFELLPPELIEQIAFTLIRQTSIVGPPKGLVEFLSISKRFNQVLGFKRNKGFYADLFKERFDIKGVERRWTVMRNIEEKREKLLLLETLPESKPSEEIHLNPSYSFTRPSSPTSFSLENPTSSTSSTNHDPSIFPSSSTSSPHVNLNPWDPLTNRDYANELVRRSRVLTKLRLAANPLPPSSSLSSSQHSREAPQGQTFSSRPSSPRSMSFTPTRGRTKLNEPDELTQNLWTCYLMLLENDGKNLAHLLEYACLREYMRLFYRHSLLAEALNPGWPRQTAGRALGLWIGWLGGDDLASETARESEERFFVLKPYVFAAHKFDAFMAPWTIPSLPVTHEDYPVLPPPAGPYLADLRPRSNAQTITHMGRKLDLSPPNLSHAAILSFFFRVEQDPSVQDDLLVQGTGTPAQQIHPNLPSTSSVGGLTAHSRPTKTTLPTLKSRIHDRDFIRMASCIDPYTSKGLPTLYTKGDFGGNWEGRFSFFDFDSYRDMLGGRMRSLYEGPFGDQPQVWKLEERIVKLEPTTTQGRGGGGGTNDRHSTKTYERTKPGGTGPVLNAGFEVGAGVPTLFGGSTTTTRPSLSQNRSSSASRTAHSQSPPPVLRRRRTISTGALDSIIMEVDQEDEAEQEGEESREGRTSKKRMRKRSEVGEPFWEDDELDEYGRRKGEEYEDGDYEILLTGSGHSAWGQFSLKGRVRSWDGMFTIIKEYTPDSRGRWIYRGYRIGDSLVGRWRDTHTPVDMSGYEGTWSMNRRK